MKLVIIESPYSGDTPSNTTYARACVRDSLQRGEAPIASHLLYTQPGILRDRVPHERQIGIEAGIEWYRVAEVCAVYTDNGISDGMLAGIERALKMGRLVVYRKLGHTR